MSEYILNYNCGPIAKQFHEDTTSEAKLLIGPVGTGKTSSAAFETIEKASARVLPTKGALRSRFAIVRNTYPELRDTTIKTYCDWFPPEVFGKFNQTDKTYLIKYDGREIELLFKALDTPKDVRDLLSMDLTGGHLEECRELHQDIFLNLLARVGRFPAVKDCDGRNPFLATPQLLLTTNYPSERHWIYRTFETGSTKYRAYHQTQDENKHNLPPGYYERLAEAYKDRPDLLRTLVNGQYGLIVVGRAVYPEFSRELHVPKNRLEPIDAQVLRGWDNSGLSPACIVTQIGPTGQWLILKEFCGDDIGITDFGEMVTLWCNQTFGSSLKYRDIGDPAGKNRDSNKMSPALYLARQGIHIEDGIQTYKIRREAVAGRLSKMINGQPAMLIDPWCTQLIEGFDGGYAFAEIGKSGIYSDEPMKNEFSHIHDAVQYPATRLFLNQSQQQRRAPLELPARFIG